MGEGSGSVKKTSRVNFLYRKVWCLKSEVPCLNCSQWRLRFAFSTLLWLELRLSSSRERHFDMRREALIVFGAVLLLAGSPWIARGADSPVLAGQEQQETEWRKERDAFFKNHERSPLTPEEKKRFKGLRYYPFDPKYILTGRIQRHVLNINNPEYYATFLTNKGTNKRYIRYGRFSFQLEGKDFSLELYKSILGDTLFIPFKDQTNGKETYEAGRYIDAEILEGYRMVLDFNKAYNPSCVYNEKFVCALAPKENTLNLEIRAGEMNFKP